MRLPRFVIIATALAVCVACSEDSSKKHTAKHTPPANKNNTTNAQTKTTDKPAADKTKQPPAPKKTKPTEAHGPGGFHLDDGKVEYHKPSLRPRPGRVVRRIYLNLMSTPPGAIASIDGVRIGPTPTYWEGPATGKPRDFTFVLSGYVLRRYRFVPVTSGTVHAPLKKVIKAQVDAGAAGIP